MKALVVDDSLLSLRILKVSLEKNGIQTFEARNYEEVFEQLEEHTEEIGAITLDREMPEFTGEEIAAKIKEYDQYKDIPIIFISSLSSRDEIKKGLEIGVYDYISKPIDSDITFLKVKNAISYFEALQEIKEREKNITRMSDELSENYQKIDELNRRLVEKNRTLEVLVEARTKELQDMTNSLIAALENANLYNDENTGDHINRVAEYSEIIARGYGLSNEYVKGIKLYSPLHDIGKVGIPDSILKKPGRYTEDEFKLMKEHVVIGHNMIKDSPLSDVAKNIALYHHEKWDGSGYAKGLAGEDIPLEARIVAIADVFDALTSKRSYKEAFSVDKALSIMEEGKGQHFDPKLLGVFFNDIDKILVVKKNFTD